MSILLHGARCIGDGYNYSGPQCMSAIFFLECLLHDQFHLKRGCEISYLHVSCNLSMLYLHWWYDFALMRLDDTFGRLFFAENRDWN